MLVRVINLVLTIEEHGKLEALNAANFLGVIEAEVLFAKCNLNLGQLGSVLILVHINFSAFAFLAKLAHANVS